MGGSAYICPPPPPHLAYEDYQRRKAQQDVAKYNYEAAKRSADQATLGAVRMEEKKVWLVPADTKIVMNKPPQRTRHTKGHIPAYAIKEIREEPLKERAKQVRREFTPEPAKDYSDLLGKISKVFFAAAAIGTIVFGIMGLIAWGVL